MAELMQFYCNNLRRDFHAILLAAYNIRVSVKASKFAQKQQYVAFEEKWTYIT